MDETRIGKAEIKTMIRFVVLVVCLLSFQKLVLALSADTTLIMEFPNLQKTNYYVATGKFPTPLCSVYLPDNFDETRKFPVILWIDGGMGGAGDCVSRVKEKVGDKNYILINFPLFKDSIEPLKPDSSNYWSRFRIRNEDSDILWNSYKIMLDSIFTLFPQIDRMNAFMGGFSNGAHATAVLLNRPQTGIVKYFNKFFFIEGGDGLDNYSILKNRCVLYMQGTVLTYPHWVKSYFKKAKNNKAKTTFVYMKGVGHDFPRERYSSFKNWVVLNTSFTKQ
jgi:hypothetical protein